MHILASTMTTIVAAIAIYAAATVKGFAPSSMNALDVYTVVKIVRNPCFPTTKRTTVPFNQQPFSPCSYNRQFLMQLLSKTDGDNHNDYSLDDDDDDDDDDLIKGYDPEYDNLNWMIEYDDLTEEQIAKLREIERLFDENAASDDDNVDEGTDDGDMM